MQGPHTARGQKVAVTSTVERLTDEERQQMVWEPVTLTLELLTG